nr:metal-dependent hydrolase [uncultured Methanobacterium sp.]
MSSGGDEDMPDWIVHVAVAWTICRVLRFRYSEFNPANTALVMVGSILPDAIKVAVFSDVIGYNLWNLLYVFHLPIGTFILAGIASLFFREKKTAFLFLSMGILTHYALDLLLIQVGYGMYLFYPVSWMGFSLNLVPNDDFYITIVALAIALGVYLVSDQIERKMLKNNS